MKIATTFTARRKTWTNERLSEQNVVFVFHSLKYIILKSNKDVLSIFEIDISCCKKVMTSPNWHARRKARVQPLKDAKSSNGSWDPDASRGASFMQIYLQEKLVNTDKNTTEARDTKLLKNSLTIKQLVKPARKQTLNHSWNLPKSIPAGFQR